MSDHASALDAAMKAGGFDPLNHVARKSVEDAVAAYLSELGGKAETVAWMHPTAGWASESYHRVRNHCFNDGPMPVPLSAIAAPPAEGGGEACPKTGLRHYYWPQGNCQYCGEMAPPLSTANAEIERLQESGQSFANQVRAITYKLNGQAYSSTVSALNQFDADLRRARAALESKGGSDADS